MNPDLKAKLEAALKAATDAGDMNTVHSIAAILKKETPSPPPSGDENETVTPAEYDTQTTAETVPVPPATPPTTPNEMEVEPAMGELYTAAQTQLEALFPGHEFEDELPDAVVIAVTDADGIETFYEITVTMNADGTATLGEPVEVQPPADEPIEPTLMTTKTKIVANDESSLIELQISANEPPNEFRIWGYGLVRTTKGDSVLTRANAEKIVKDWQDKATLLHFDYEHGTFSDAALAGQPVPASGWYKLEARDDGLWAVDIEWTEKAKEMIRTKEYRYYSPAYLVDNTTNEIVAYENGALTNLPATKGIQVLMKAKSELEQVVTAKNLEITKLKHEKFQIEVTANIKTLIDAGVPPAVLRMVRPILEADDTATLVKTSAKDSSKPGRLVLAALLEMIKVGAIPQGEITRGKPDQSLADLEITLSNAVDLIKKENSSLRDADAIIAARKRYPHLVAD